MLTIPAIAWAAFVATTSASGGRVQVSPESAGVLDVESCEPERERIAAG